MTYRVLPALPVGGVVREGRHDPGVDLGQGHPPAGTGLDGHGDESNVGVRRLLCPGGVVDKEGGVVGRVEEGWLHHSLPGSASVGLQLRPQKSPPFIQGSTLYSILGAGSSMNVRSKRLKHLSLLILKAKILKHKARIFQLN